VNRLTALVALAAAAGACQQAQPAPLYETVPVARRDIVVTAVAAGVIQPRLTYSVKSKAWGEIIALPVQTGDEVRRGQLLARIDPRIPRNNLAEAQAALDKAKAQLANAQAQLQRAAALYEAHAIAETDYERAKLAHAVAQAAVATAQAALQTAQDAMEDTEVRAPITGTVLDLAVALGTVISSPTLGGGTVILKMANLDTVRDSALVPEADVGRIHAGVPVTITVDAYPDTTFTGTVAKVGPQALEAQNATWFPVFVDIPNPRHLLKPGMNTTVRIHTGTRQGVLAIPNAALRTPQDVGSAASLLGLDSAKVRAELAAARPRGGGGGGGGGGGPAGGGDRPGVLVTPTGREITLPPGVTAEQVRAAFRKMASGAELTPAERAVLAQLRSQFRGGGGGGENGAGRRRPREYVVFALRGGKPVAVAIETGLTDQDYVEVTAGLAEGDTVLILPSASLVESQQRFRQRFQNVTGGGLPGLRQQPPGGTPR
jgi:HlyD family secretion protein